MKPSANLLPTSEALLLCGRAELSPPEHDRLLELFDQDFDWDYFYRLARRHSLVPLVYRQLESSIKDQVPADVRQRFRKDYQENAARNVVLTDELVSLIEGLANEGIDAIAFKGPVLALSAYGNVTLRRFVDLDLIVRRADIGRAIQALERRGYAPAKSLTKDQQRLLLRTQHNLQFTRGRIIVELHWQVSSHLFASTVTAEELWQHLETVEINGQSVKTLATEDLLFALCVHGSRHVWEKLAWICDLDRIVRTADLNWPTLMDRAQKAHADRMFLLGLALADHLFGTELPAQIVQAISRDSRISILVTEISGRLFDGPEPFPLRLRAVFRFNFLIRTDWRSRLNYCRFLFFPSDRDLESLRLPRSFQFVYYVLRPFRLLRSAGARQTDTVTGEARNAQN